MSYGTITSSGTIDTTFSFSNDFSISRSGTGTYVITFLEWMGTKPMLIITPSNSSPSNGYSAVYTIGTDTYGRYQATVYTYHSTNKADEAFGFEARFGHVLTFDATKNATLSLQPSVISFGSPSTTVLVLSTTIASLKVGGATSSFNAKLDKGTALLGVGSTLTLSLGAASVSDGRGNTWDLTGYTYGGGSGTTGTAWIDNKATLTISTGGPATTPELFVVKGTPHSGNSNLATLSTDPLVRLSSVPPGGLSV